MMIERYVRPVAGLLPMAMLVGTSVASAADTLEEVVVFARGEQQIGRAAASEGAVGGADLSVRPLLHVAELLEVVPGMGSA